MNLSCSYFGSIVDGRGSGGIREGQEHKVKEICLFLHPDTGLFVDMEHFACPENPAGRKHGGYEAARAAAGFQLVPAEKPGSPGVGATQPPQPLPRHPAHAQGSLAAAT